MTGYYVAVAALAILNVASIILSLAVAMRLQRLEKEIGARPLSSLPPDPLPPSTASVVAPEAVEGGDKFAAALMGGEMNLRLSQERDSREPPEKYRYVGSLAAQGMSAEEIARVLHLSPGEVQQLLTLARLGRGEGA